MKIISFVQVRCYHVFFYEFPLSSGDIISKFNPIFEIKPLESQAKRLWSKIDTEGASPERIMQELSALGLMPEEWVVMYL